MVCVRLRVIVEKEPCQADEDMDALRARLEAEDTARWSSDEVSPLHSTVCFNPCHITVGQTGLPLRVAHRLEPDAAGATLQPPGPP